jgi:hypothetical protein
MQKVWYIFKPKKEHHHCFKKGGYLGMSFQKMGVFVDPERKKAIIQIHMPNNKKSMQSFFKKINFVRIFMANFEDSWLTL